MKFTRVVRILSTVTVAILLGWVMILLFTSDSEPLDLSLLTIWTNMKCTQNSTNCLMKQQPPFDLSRKMEAVSSL